MITDDTIHREEWEKLEEKGISHHHRVRIRCGQHEREMMFEIKLYLIIYKSNWIVGIFVNKTMAVCVFSLVHLSLSVLSICRINVISIDAKRERERERENMSKQRTRIKKWPINQQVDESRESEIERKKKQTLNGMTK